MGSALKKDSCSPGNFLVALATSSEKKKKKKKELVTLLNKFSLRAAG